MTKKAFRSFSVVFGVAALILATTLQSRATTGTCPAGATVTGLALLMGFYHTNPVTGMLEPLGPSAIVGSCDTVLVYAELYYLDRDPLGNIVCGFSDGQIFIRGPGGFVTNVTPAGGRSTFSWTGD